MVPVPPAGGMKLLVNFFSKKLRVQPVGHYPYSRAVRGSIECGRALPLPGEGRVSKGSALWRPLRRRSYSSVGAPIGAASSFSKSAISGSILFSSLRKCDW